MKEGDAMDKVIAIILNYNSSHDCEKCVSYLMKQDYENFSIIIVDNASSDKNELEILQSISKKNNIKLIISKKNGGFSAGNNIGLREAVNSSSDWALIINPDVELRNPHYISYVMEQAHNYKEVALIGTNVIMPSGMKQNPMRELRAWEEILWPLEIIKQKLGIWNNYRGEDCTGYCEKVSGCCFFISREFLLKNNYLDENVFMYCEEPILAKSVIKQGFRELYIKEVTANHEHYSHSKSGNSASKMKLFLDSRIYYIKEYSGYTQIAKIIAILSRKIQQKVYALRGNND